MLLLHVLGVVMAMRRLVAALALEVAAAGGVLVPALPASAEVVTCGSMGFSAEKNGTAWARDCSYSGDGAVRLSALCDVLPQTAHSRLVYGKFSGVDFDTTVCTFGVREAHFDHT
ncbi:hypothetical protein D5S17_18905 [Pseudonocardiaceae bacterium YIM PH 21723]|nr:hypothetical protein D5S17_18905 [Pseudonocardiaceae bacterium YIM PH 21723]